MVQVTLPIFKAIPTASKYTANRRIMTGTFQAFISGSDNPLNLDELGQIYPGHPGSFQRHLRITILTLSTSNSQAHRGQVCPLELAAHPPRIEGVLCGPAKQGRQPSYCPRGFS